MKITKYVHSCLVIEDSEYTAITDPGEFSWESGLFNVDTLTRLDDIIITHEHYDHMSIPFLRTLLEKFPDAKVITTPAAAKELASADITNVTTKGTDNVRLFATSHEPMGQLGAAPENTGVHVLEALTHPGDSHHFAETKEVLALPVQGPWGSFKAAAELGITLAPKYIIPIHDWHWNDVARQQFYDRLQAFYANHGITFIKPQDGVAFEV